MKKKRALRKKDPAKTLIRIAARAIKDTKGYDLAALDLKKLATYADYLVIASAANSRQLRALANRVEESVTRETKKAPIGVEGLKTASWVLMDYGNVVIHLFLEETRSFYRLENLWYDARRMKI